MWGNEEMKRTSAAMLALAVLCATVGCVSPTPQQLQVAQTAREQAARLLVGFQEAMRSKDGRLLRPLVAPTMSPTEFMWMGLRMEGASWLNVNAGYTLEVDRALQGVSWRRWHEPPVEITVPVRNANGERFKDEFVLAEGQSGWYIKDFTVRVPMPGDVVSPPAAVVEKIRPEANRVMAQLFRGEIAELYMMLPNDPASRYRTPQVSFWQRLTMSEPVRPVNIYDDLRRMKMLRITRWPDPTEPLEFTWIDYGALAVTYDLPHMWDGAEPETLHIELVFIKQGTDWVFNTIRLSGAAIPYS